MMRCYDALVRTTLDLDDDVLAAARAVARMEGRSLGRVVSDLARRGLAPAAPSLEEDDGFPVFAVPPGVGPLTPDMVQAALDES